MTFDQFCLQFNTTDQEREELRAMLAAIRMKQFIAEVDPVAMVLIRTLVADAERTGSWHVPVDIQERMVALVKEISR